MGKCMSWLSRVSLLPVPVRWIGRGIVITSIWVFLRFISDDSVVRYLAILLYCSCLLRWLVGDKIKQKAAVDQDKAGLGFLIQSRG